MNIKIEILESWLEHQHGDIVIHLDEDAVKNVLSSEDTQAPPSYIITPEGGKGKAPGPTVQALLKAYADELRSKGKIRTAQTYVSTLSSFGKFCPKGLPIEILCKKTIKDYECWLREKGLARNTCSFYLRRLRAVYRQAVEIGLTENQSLFDHVFTGMERTQKRAIPPEQLRQLIGTVPENPRTAFALDMFRFSLFTRGMSFVDMCFLRRANIRNGILSYRRKKTGQLLHIRWESQMEDIVKRYEDKCSTYLLPLIKDGCGDELIQYKRRQHTLNNHLKALGWKLGFPNPLTMYVARHSWASTAKSMNVPLSVISDAMGHNSERTTQIYLTQIDSNIIDETNASIIKFLDYKDRKK